MKHALRLTELMPVALVDFLDKAVALGFTPILVGGAVRDLMLGAEAICDWDFELQHPQGTDGLWSKLQHQLKNDYRLQSQPQAVVKAQSSDRTLVFEFAPPRLEAFPEKEVYAHSDLETKVAFALPFEESVRRRDFTLNAMGMAWTGRGWELRDPLNGAEALKARELRPCDPTTFVKDPVRFVRAHRFALKLGLGFSAELKELLERMNIELLTGHYLAEEAAKSGRPFEFWNSLQWAESLPARFQGGLSRAEEMQAIYGQRLPRLGVSNALLASAFHYNEGWYLLGPLGGKGEREVALWRERRELIRELHGRTPESCAAVAEDVRRLCSLTKSPQQWLREDWVLETLKAQGLEWVGTRPWPGVDVREFLPEERQMRKVLAWLQS